MKSIIPLLLSAVPPGSISRAATAAHDHKTIPGPQGGKILESTPHQEGDGHGHGRQANCPERPTVKIPHVTESSRK